MARTPSNDVTDNVAYDRATGGDSAGGGVRPDTTGDNGPKYGTEGNMESAEREVGGQPYKPAGTRDDGGMSDQHSSHMGQGSGDF